MTKCIIIGGGAAGSFAAALADNCVIIEKNDKLCTKLRITGKGRCNLTNCCDIQQFLKNVHTNAKFVQSALHALPPAALMQTFERWGVPLKVERGNRVFPQSDNALDIVKALQKQTAHNTIIRGQVQKLIIADGCAKGVILTDGRSLLSDRVIIATGGVSYPKTGSTGDGYELAKQAGHMIVPLKPSLVPLVVEENVKHIEGLTLKNVRLTVFEGDKKIYSDMGEMLFTANGVSGPLVLTASSHITKPQLCEISIDLKPALDDATLHKRILRAWNQIPNKIFANSLDDILPKSLIPVIVRRAGIMSDVKVNSITKQQRAQLCEVLKNFKFKVTDFRPIAEAIITRGGVNVKEVNPKTMESKLCKNLYFAGECLDIDAYTGGFNLHLAFCTAAACACN